jgi:arginine/lysine/ornithine decarboxylase
MNTPIYDFVQNYCESNAVRLHMPGHKGVAGPLGVEPSDITEIEGADVLSRACGIIAESEANAGTLFGCRTLYSTEGSSLCVRAMVFLLKKIAIHKGREPRILAARNMHRSFLDAVAALDVAVDWIMPLAGDPYERCDITGEELAQIISDCRDDDRMPTAVFVTSPDYLGHALDIAELAEVCHSRGCYLAVDNAHGAYRKFLAVSEHPMDFGADLCCDSAHKTLPVLTGGAYLHISRNTDPFFTEYAGQAMALFATTSPSYLVLQSLDLCNAYLEECGAAFEKTARRTDQLKDALTALGYRTCGEERLKITLVAGSCFADGCFLATRLRERGIYVEYADENHVVMMFSVKTPEDDFHAVEMALRELANTGLTPELPENADTFASGETAGRSAERIPAPGLVLTPAEAILAESEYVDAAQCVGRVLAEPIVSMPPCVPLYMCGEVLGENAVRFIKGRVRVVKEPVRRTHR